MQHGLVIHANMEKMKTLPKNLSLIDDHVRFKKWLNDHKSENRWEIMSDIWDLILFKFPKIRLPVAADREGYPSDHAWTSTKVASFAWNFIEIYLEIEADDTGLFQWYATNKKDMIIKSEGTEKPNKIISEKFWSWIKKVASIK